MIVSLKHRWSGFTLVELLIALLVFSLLSAFAYRSVVMLTGLSKAQRIEVTELEHVQKMMALLENDVRQHLAKNEGVGAAVEMSNVDEKKTLYSDFKKVHYFLNQGVLYRKLLSPSSIGVEPFSPPLRLLALTQAQTFLNGEAAVEMFKFPKNGLISVRVELTSPLLGEMVRVFAVSVNKPFDITGNYIFNFDGVGGSDTPSENDSGEPSEAELIDAAVL